MYFLKSIDVEFLHKKHKHSTRKVRTKHTFCHKPTMRGKTDVNLFNVNSKVLEWSNIHYVAIRRFTNISFDETEKFHKFFPDVFATDSWYISQELSITQENKSCWTHCGALQRRCYCWSNTERKKTLINAHTSKTHCNISFERCMYFCYVSFENIKIELKEFRFERNDLNY